MPSDLVQQTCTPRARCHNWRVCETCAHIRAGHIADMATRLAAAYPELHWTIIEPDDAGPLAMTDSRRAWARAARVPAAIWTIEQSTTGRLHANVIHPPTTLSHHRVPAHIITTPITGDVARVARYIAKRDQAPDPVTGPHRCAGTLGPLWAALASEHQAPLVAAAAWQHALTRADAASARPRRPRADPPPPPYHRPIAATPRPDLTWDEYRALAVAHLPDLLRYAAAARARRANLSKTNER